MRFLGKAYTLDPASTGLEDDVVAAAPSYANLPVNTTLTLTKSGGTWPGSPTDREDIKIIWVGADPSPPTAATRTIGQAHLVNGDLRVVI